MPTTSYTKALFLWVGIPLAFAACQKNKANAHAIPDSSDVVAVNTVVRVEYVRANKFRESALNKKDNFQFMECPSGESGEPNSEAPTKETDPKEKLASKTDRTPVSGPVSYILHHVVTTEKQEKGDTTLDVYRTQVYLIPIPESGAETPLKPNTNYCVVVRDMDDEQNETATGTELSFTTEDRPSFRFEEESVSAQWINSENTQLGPLDFIYLKLELPIIPSALSDGTTSCLVDREETSKKKEDSKYVLSESDCTRYNGSTYHRVSYYMVESFEEKEGVIVAQYNTFALDSFEPNQSFVIKPGLSKNDNPVDLDEGDRIEFRVSSLDKKMKAAERKIQKQKNFEKAFPNQKLIYLGFSKNSQT